MKNLLKLIYPTGFVLALLLSFPLKTHARCDIFNFPHAKNNDVLFFSCETGEIMKTSENGKFETLSGQKSLGSGVSHFLWSPDGTKALILAENISAAKQELELSTREREINSLNWWVYDLESGKSSLLDKNIVSIGWISSDEVIYNWTNQDISTAKINDPSLKEHKKIAAIKDDSNDIEKIVPPASLHGTVIFPLEKGFWAIDTKQPEAKYFPLPSGIQKAISGKEGAGFFLVQSGNSLQKYIISEKKIVEIDASFSAASAAIVDKKTLVIVDAGGKLHSYDTDTKETKPIAINVPGKVSEVFPAKNSREFIFSTGNAIYKKNIDSGQTTKILSEEAITGDDTTEAQLNPEVVSPAPEEGPSLVVLIISGIILITTLSGLVYIKLIKKL